MKWIAGAVLSVIIAVSVPVSALDQTARSMRCVDNPECQEAARERSVDAARNGRYMDASFGLLAALEVKGPEQISDPDVFDQWSQVWSAMTAWPYPNQLKTPYSHIRRDEIAALEAAKARPALAEIIDRAKRTRIVILDEDHLVPRDRLFGLEVARALRPLGYRVLAAEALTRDRDDALSREKMNKLTSDGYVRLSSGYYLNDPVFADFLRQAIAMGYRLVSYESAGFTDEKTPEARSSRREQEQAENILHRALVADPLAKVLIYCGRHHAAKAEINDPKVSERLWMAMRLKQLTGIDALVIDQVELGEMPSDRQDADLYSIASRKAKAGSVVLMNQSKPLVVGLLSGGVDLQVVHPRTTIVYGRPAWLMKLGRKPVRIPTALLPRRGTRLIQVFLAGEPQDAVPIDQVLVSAGRTPPELMLPKGSVRYAHQDEPSARQPSQP